MSSRASGVKPGITKAVLAGVVATTLGLAACGSDEADGDEATTSASTSATSAEETTSEAAEDTEESEVPESEEPDDDESAQPEDGPAPEGDADQDDDAEVGAQGDEPAPDHGDPAPAAAPDDAAEITALVEGFGEDKPYSEYYRYTIATTCNADLDQRGGREALLQDDGDGQGNEMASEVMSGVYGGLPVIHGVNDINVDDGRASANIDQTENNERSTIPMNFVHEEGEWRHCVA